MLGHGPHLQGTIAFMDTAVPEERLYDDQEFREPITLKHNNSVLEQSQVLHR